MGRLGAVGHCLPRLARHLGGVSEKMLAQSLQGLEGDGFVVRRSYPVVPPHVDYSLSPMGAEVTPQVEPLADWIEANVARVLEARRSREAAANER